jgi:CRP/FNR family transcriptional regulator, cyclic AMP receptor protein
MSAILEHCNGGRERLLPAGTLVIREGETTGRLHVLLEGRLDVLKGDTLVASLAEPGAVVGEMSVLLGRPHSATVRAARASTVYEFDEAAGFLRSHPAIALDVARLLAQRLHAATSYLADIKRQYAGHGDHLAMVGEVLESLVNQPATSLSPGSDRDCDQGP